MFRNLLVLLFLVLLSGFVFVACGDAVGTSTPETDVTGSWSGIFNEIYEGLGIWDATLTVSQNGNNLSGSAVVDGESFNLSGTGSGSSISVNLDCTTETGWIIYATGTVNGNRITGTWEDNYPAPDTWGGTFTVTR